MLHNHLCQTFHNGTLAHAWLTDEHRVVFLAATKYLHHTLHLFLTAHNRVEFTFRCGFGQVCREIIEHRGLARGLASLCRGALGLLALASVFTLAVHQVVIIVFVITLIGQTNTIFGHIGLKLEIGQCVFVIHVVDF